MTHYRKLPEPLQRVNFIYRIKEGWLIFWASTLVSLYVGIFYLGKEFGKYEQLTATLNTNDGKQVSETDTTKKNAADSSAYNKVGHIESAVKGDPTKPK